MESLPDYKAYNFNIEKTDFVVIHIPDQIGDAMAIFPVIRALELHKIKHLLIVTSTINLEVFNRLNELYFSNLMILVFC